MELPQETVQKIVDSLDANDIIQMDETTCQLRDPSTNEHTQANTVREILIFSNTIEKSVLRNCHGKQLLKYLMQIYYISPNSNIFSENNFVETMKSKVSDMITLFELNLVNPDEAFYQSLLNFRCVLDALLEKVKTFQEKLKELFVE